MMKNSKSHYFHKNKEIYIESYYPDSRNQTVAKKSMVSFPIKKCRSSKSGPSPIYFLTLLMSQFPAYVHFHQSLLVK